MEIERREITVERSFVTINGEEVRARIMHDFLMEIEGTSAMFPLRWDTEFDKVGELLVEEDVVGKTAKGSWYVKDEERRREMLEEIITHYEE